MRFLIDMNLPPAWVEFFFSEGIDSVHWSTVGRVDAPDEELMEWASDNGFVVFTHDLDFGALLAVSKLSGPSVIQVRTQNVMPEAIGSLILNAIHTFSEEISTGALISIDLQKARVRILPIN